MPDSFDMESGLWLSTQLCLCRGGEWYFCHLYIGTQKASFHDMEQPLLCAKCCHRALHRLIQAILGTTVGDAYWYQPHFADEETEGDENEGTRPESHGYHTASRALNLEPVLWASALALCHADSEPPATCGYQARGMWLVWLRNGIKSILKFVWWLTSISNSAAVKFHALLPLPHFWCWWEGNLGQHSGVEDDLQ